MTAVIPVGLGEACIGDQDEQVLVCYGLGSCISLALYDASVRVGVMVHIVLPDSGLQRHREPGPASKFADTAVPDAISKAVRLGAKPHRLSARMVGGARMLGSTTGGQLDVGARNVTAVKEALERTGIPLVAADTGGTYGRTVQFFIQSGRLNVSTVGRGERDL